MTKEPEQEAAGLRALDRRVLMAGLFAAGLIPLLATPVLPLIDFYNHLARFFVLGHLGSGSALQAHYQAHWSLLPDIGIDLIGTPLLILLPPLVAGHIIVVGIFAVLFGGVLYLNRVLTGQRSLLVAALLLPLLYSYILNWGFANFLLGLGLAFWAAGWWLSHRNRPRLAVPVSCLFSIAIFLTHGIAFVLYGILVASLEIGLFVSAPNRNPRDLVRALFLVGIQAFIPVAFFLYWIATNGHEDSIASAAALAAHGVRPPPRGELGARILRRLVPILRVEEGPTYWFDIATFAVQALALFFLMARGRIALVKPAWPLIVAAIATVAIGMPVIFGTGYITDRMPLFAALCLLSALSLRRARWTTASRVACGILVATVCLRLVVTAFSWHAYGQSYREYRSLAAMIPRGSMVIGVPVGSFYHETDVPRCEMYGPLLIAQYDQAGPLFGQRNQHPLLLAGSLKAATDTLSVSFALDNIKDYEGYIAAAASLGFSHMLICNTQLLTRPFPENVTLVARTAHFALLRAKSS